MKDSNLVKNLKNSMRSFLNIRPNNYALSFNDYLEISAKLDRDSRHLFYSSFIDELAVIADFNFVEDPHIRDTTFVVDKNLKIKPGPIIQVKDEPNVIFGVLDNGEIFVEVNGVQHTPDESFYKISTLQASNLAHQVRDLELEKTDLESKVKKCQVANIALDGDLTALKMVLLDIADKLEKVGY